MIDVRVGQLWQFGTTYLVVPIRFIRTDTVSSFECRDFWKCMIYSIHGRTLSSRFDTAYWPDHNFVLLEDVP